MIDRQLSFGSANFRGRAAPPGAIAVARDSDRLASTGRLREWLPLSLTSGFIATGVITCALFVAAGWAQLFTATPLVTADSASLGLALMLHVAAGLVWAGLYAVFFEPAIAGPGWRKGLIFALLLWTMSLSVLLPGSQLDAVGLGFSTGMVSIAVSLILHLVYGVILGHIYGNNRVLTENGRPRDVTESRVLARAQRAMAFGLLPGAIIGCALGGLASSIAPGIAPAIILAIATIFGASAGLLVGSFAALTAKEAENPVRSR